MIELLFLKLPCLLVVLLWYGVMVSVLLLVFILSALDTNNNGNWEKPELGIIEKKTRDKLIKASHLNLLHT
jgi:hypothetical protein